VSDEALPKSWAYSPIGDCCDLNPKLDKSQFDDAQEVHFVPMPAVEALTNKIDISTTRAFGEVRKGYTPFTGGDVIFAKITPCMENGKTAVVPYLPHGLAFGSTEFHVVRPYGDLGPLWFFYFLSSRSFRSNAEHNMTGAVGQRRVPIDFIASSPIPLPPLAEQKRIVAKIEELFSELEAGEESLRSARRQLATYRQSLLKQAFEGKLTQTWRTQNPDKLDAWSWLTLEAVAEVTGGLTKNSKRDSLPTRIPYLGVANVYANELRLDEIKNIGVTTAESEKVRLVKGDLLIVEGNGSLDQIGRVALWNGSIPNCGHQNHLIRARCRAMAHPAFVLMFLLSPHGRDAIEKQAASTSGLHTLSVSKVQRLPVPLCALPEQQEIVRLLDEQFEAIERNEREIDAALRRSEALRQAILKKAFTGKLVPQDPADEPATELLARLRAAKAKATTADIQKKPRNRRLASIPKR